MVAIRLAIVIAGFLAYAFVLINKWYHIRKIWRRNRPPKNVSRLFLILTQERYIGWARLGAYHFNSDPLIGTLLLTTRTLGASLTSILNLQKTVARPSTRQIVHRVLRVLLVLGIQCTILVALPQMKLIDWLLRTSVALCFGIMIFYELPQSIRATTVLGSSGALYRLQLATLVNYLVSFVIGFYTADSGFGLFMRWIYAAATIMQSIYVGVIALATQRYRRSLQQEKQS